MIKHIFIRENNADDSAQKLKNDETMKEVGVKAAKPEAVAKKAPVKPPKKVIVYSEESSSEEKSSSEESSDEEMGDTQAGPKESNNRNAQSF